ncbi:MAG TPA: TonB-dependent receptor [Draconibacterium sp.]|nr:TonB-dependent receptor [Draconibacterium sp.]
MRKIFTCILLLLFFQTAVNAQTGSIKGIVTDFKTNETLIGTTVLIQGTTQGTITNFDGGFLIQKVNPGKYNLVVSFISYQSKIVQIEVENGNETVVNVSLEPATLDIGEVKVVAQRRTDTDMSLISGLKAQNLIVNGISAQQISRSQDKDAAEVIRRVPGITITDGRFVIVRGLIERYNSVMLNNATAPSFEADKRAFSFDAIPSGLINNILIYKSPSPELPADFAGAVINVETKSVADENSLVISYGTKYIQNTSFTNDFKTHPGSKTDWLGFDNGTRDIPAGTPSPEAFSELYNWESAETYKQKTDEITNISKSFANNWQTFSKKPFLDQNFSVTSQRRFLIGKASLGNITSVNYSHSNDYREGARTEYQKSFDDTGMLQPDFDFRDGRSTQSAKFGAIFNWNLIYSKNQKLEFRNFFYNNGVATTSIRNGLDNNGLTVRLHDLKFENRTIYSGQLAGEQIFNKDRTKFNWMAGYGRTNTNQPDNRRLTFVFEDNENSTNYGKYSMRIQNVPNAYLGGRLWLDMNENVYDAKADLEHNFKPFDSETPWKLKTGFFYEIKNREFGSRLIGTVALRNPPIDFFQPIEDIMNPENFFFDQTAPYTQHGLSYRDNTRAKDSYNAADEITAGYLSLFIPVTKKLNITGGVRVEKFHREITDFYEPTPTPELFDIIRDTTNFFPSVNLTYNLTEKHLFRASFGQTVNRPEFREMSNFDYQDFDLFVLVHGNGDLQNAYIKNYDIRYEWYPQPGEIISVAGFYKDFINPIEIFLIPAGTGYDYKPYNTEKAKSMGIEIDVRKRLTELESSTGFIRNLKDITLIFNTSLIKSQITTEQTFAREETRVMQGQSPYIINLGINYSGENNGLIVNLSYNKIGKRIAFVGTPNNPHTWELPRNSFDLTVQKNMNEHLSAKIGLQDLINDPVQFVQYYGADESVEVNTMKYFPNRALSFSLVYKL